MTHHHSYTKSALEKRIPSRLSAAASDSSPARPLTTQLLVISLFAATASFLVSLSWQKFLSDAVDAVQRSTNQKIPVVVSQLITAIVVTAVMVGVIVGLYRWERKEAAAADDEDGA